MLIQDSIQNSRSKLSFQNITNIVQGGGFNHAGPEKADERGGGGDSDTFFFFFFVRHLHYWVGVPSVYQINLRVDKQKKKKNQRGGGV